MSNIYSKRLYGPALTAAAEAALYTVPAGKVAVIMNVILVQAASPGSTVVLAIGLASVTANRILRFGTTADTTHQIVTRVPMVEGEVLRGLSTTGLVAVTVTGYEFDV